MYIDNLRIRNYKCFYKSKIEFSKSISTLIGENGTGKTNLFYAIKLLTDKNSRYFLNEDSFSYNLENPKGNWIILSCEFKEIEEEYEAIRLNPDINRNATYSYIFRPNRKIRNDMYELSEKYKNCEDEQKENIKLEIKDFLNKIDIKNDYEVIRSINTIFNFLDDKEYKNIVGDFENFNFPNPEEQEDKKIIGDIAREVNDIINVTFIPAIRDVDNELTKENNFFIKLLKDISEDVQDETWERIYKLFNEANIEINKIDEFNALTKDISEKIEETVGKTYASSVAFDMSIPSEKNNIIKNFSLKSKGEGEKEYKLSNNSLGENNIVYFALKFLDSKRKVGHTKKLLNLLLIEEPEAHLHKHLQKTLFEGIKDSNDYQVILSTHSVHISESSHIGNSIVLGKKNGNTEVYIPAYGLEQEEIKKISRYLDATRVPVLFSKNVILVEGTAELVLIPVLIKQKYGIDLDKYGISIISMDSTMFEPIAKLFNKNRIRKKCAILTDLDKDYTKARKYESRENKSHNRVKRLMKAFEHNEYVNIYTNDYTFEVEFFKDNINLLKELIKDKKYYSNIDVVERQLDSENVEIKYDRIIKLCSHIGKGWLAIDTAEFIENKSINIQMPKYICEALKFIFSNNYNEKIFIGIVKYYLENDKEGEKIDDEFIKWLINDMEMKNDDITEIN